MIKKLGIASMMMALTFTPAMAEDMDETLKRFKETGKITIGHRESSIPFAYVDPKSGPIGFSLDLCHEIVDRIGEKLGVSEPEIDHVPVTSQNRIILVQNGTVDLECGSTSNTLERQKQVAFSYSFFITAVRMMVREGSPVDEFADMSNRTFVISSGSSSDSLVKNLASAAGFIPNISYAKENAASFLYVQSERADAFVSDDILLAGLIANAPNPESFAIVGETLRDDPYGFMMRREDTAFKALVDTNLAEIMSDGTYETLYTKWFQSPIPPRDINFGYEMSAAVKAAIANPTDEGK